MTQGPPRFVWPRPDEDVEVTVRQLGWLMWDFTITQAGSMMASDGTALTRAGALRAARRRVRALRLDVQREADAVRFRL